MSSKKLTYDFAKEFIENNNCKLIDEVQESITSKDKLNIQCMCGNIFTTTFNHFKSQNKRQCDGCTKERIKKTNTKTHEQFVKEVYDLEGDRYEVIGRYIKANTKLEIKHRECGKTYEVKPNNFLTGYRCPYCSHKNSYPEQLMIAVFIQLGINFQTQLTKTTLKWCNGYRYDFYFNLNGEEILTETHGKQHYEESFKRIQSNKKVRSLEEEQENDKMKKELAIKNGIKEENYIVIDCRKSELEFIKNNILYSRLGKLFDLSQIDWNKAEEFTLDSTMKKACDLWNSGITCMKDIAKILKVNKDTVTEYLKKGKSLLICDYNIETTRINSRKSKNKKTIRLEDSKIYDSATLGAKDVGIKSQGINKCCLGQQQTAGGYHWMYYEDYLKNTI